MKPLSKPPIHKAVRIRSELHEGENGKSKRHWRTLFLDILADTSNVSAAARRAGINPSRAYKNRRGDPLFARQWHQALIEGYTHLEMETLHRLRMGTTRDDPKFDIANALRLLTLHKDTVARDRARQGVVSEAEVLASINAKIAAMRAREADLAQDMTDRKAPRGNARDREPETAIV